MTAKALDGFLLFLVGLFCGALAWMSLDIRPPARVFPLTVSGLTLCLAALALLRSLLSANGSTSVDSHRRHLPPAAMVGLAAYVATMSTSYFFATCLFLFAGYVFLMADRTPVRLLVAAGLAITVSALTWLCFSVVLGVNLPG